MESHNLPTTREISYHLPKKGNGSFFQVTGMLQRNSYIQQSSRHFKASLLALAYLPRFIDSTVPVLSVQRQSVKYSYSIILCYKPTFKLEQFWQLVQFTILEQSWQLVQFSMLEQFWHSVQLVMFEHCWHFWQLLQLLQNEQSTQSLQLEHWIIRKHISTHHLATPVGSMVVEWSR